MVGIVVISHGDMAKGAISSLDLIDPGQKQIAFLSVRPETNPDDFSKDLADVIHRVDMGDGVLILADLLGGTPCSSSIGMISSSTNVLTGFNLPMLLSAVTLRSGISDCDELAARVEQEAHSGINNVKRLLKENGND